MRQVTVPSRQRGLTMISWMLVIGVAVFFVVLGMRLIPSYIEYYSVRTVLQALAQDRRSPEMSPGQIKESIIKRLKINGVYDFDRKNITIKKEKGKINVKVAYEVRKNMVGNVDAVMAFSDQVEF